MKSKLVSTNVRSLKGSNFRFSPDEWVIEDGANGGSRIRNQFSVGNSFWFALSSLAQQSNELAPRYVHLRSLKMLCGVEHDSS